MTTYIHDRTVLIHDDRNRHIGEIDVRVHYKVTDWGAPMRMYFRNGDPGTPAESAEIAVTAVTMEIPSSLQDPAYTVRTKAWDWLYDHVSTLAEAEWADELADEARAEEGDRMCR